MLGRIARRIVFRSFLLTLLCVFVLAMSVGLPRFDFKNLVPQVRFDPNRLKNLSSNEEVIKWCSNEGGAPIYAQANAKLQGYTPCERLGTSIVCSRNGTRYIVRDGGSGENSVPCPMQVAAPKITFPEGKVMTMPELNLLESISKTKNNGAGKKKRSNDSEVGHYSEELQAAAADLQRSFFKRE